MLSNVKNFLLEFVHFEKTKNLRKKFGNEAVSVWRVVLGEMVNIGLFYDFTKATNHPTSNLPFKLEK